MSTHRLISGATVIDIYTGAQAEKDILIHADKIVGLGSTGSLEVPDGTEKIDAVGQYVIPGLWDAHIHMTLWPEYTDQLAALCVANGITSVRDFGGRLDDVIALRQQSEQQNTVAPRMWIAGPIVDGTPQIVDGMAVAVSSVEEATVLVDTLVEQGIDFIKPYEMLRPDVFKALVQRAHYHHRPAAGHVPMRMAMSEVLEIGHYDFQHLGGVCSGMRYDCVQDQHPVPDRKALLEARAPDESGADLMMKVANATDLMPEYMDPEKIANLVKRFVEKGAWHTPTLVGIVSFRDLGFTEDPFVTDTLHYLPEPRQLAALEARQSDADPTSVYKFGPWSMEIVNQLHKAGVKLLAGTDSPPIPTYTPAFCLHLELKAMVLAGLSPLAALQTATLNPAEFFGITDEFGSIDIGKCADMVLLEKDPLIDIDNCRHIKSVISRGQFFDRKKLDALLASIAEQQKSPA